MYTLQPKHDLRVGERVGVWARPTDNELYLFGYGKYLGEQPFNGESHPVIRFDHNSHEEYVVHYQHVSYGRETGIQRTCSNFRGYVHNVDLKAFLEEGFEPPVVPEGEEGASNKEAKPKEPPKPKTAFDKLHLLGQELSMCRKKLLFLKDAIVKTETVIQDKLKSMESIKSLAFAEVAALEKGEDLEPFVDPNEPKPTEANKTTSSTEEHEEGGNSRAPESSSAGVNTSTSSTCDTCGSDLGPTGCTVCN